MKFENYLESVKKAAEHPKNEQRLGQLYFNILAKWRSDLTDVIRATENDPFYDDRRIPQFLKFVRQHWYPEHRLTIIERPYPGDSQVMYWAICSCDNYQSNKTPQKLDAEKMWLNHMIAKTQNES